MSVNEQPLRLSQIFAFFLPLSVAACLVTVSHLIISSTLARSANPQIVIAAYAIAISLMGIVERPAVLLRQTCSRLVSDRRSFRSMAIVTTLVIIGIVSLGLIIAYTHLGVFIFRRFFGVDDALVKPILDIYRILMFVGIFSGLRGLFQGIIISNRQTKWLTVGMVIRLAVMYMLSVYFIRTDQVSSGKIGAIIFFTGMAIECAVSIILGVRVLKRLKLADTNRPAVSQKHIFRFYQPLLYSSIIAVSIEPLTNALLGRTNNIELSIASFAIAASLTNLITSLVSYSHQIVLNFYNVDRKKARQFIQLASLIPLLIMALLCYTPLGLWVMHYIMGIDQLLMNESLKILRIFMIFAFVFPWLDYCNGLVMLSGRTKIMLLSQSSNVLMTFGILIFCIMFFPHLNGMIGSLAQSIGMLSEISVVLLVMRLSKIKLNELPLNGN
ncbi:multi antimicrobial extrusion protein MatE [Cohnella cellulosilytica]|uniref:Multi antimicrobial extrusion protein MatE n=1 Tax=Cohnella cellulosilytica TaxID=986710 RepID=A0ABW2F7D1_9BACL